MSEYAYKSVRVVFTGWDEVYVYGDGELIDTIDFTGMDEEFAKTMFEEYTLDAKASKLYDLDEEYDEDILPDEFRKIPKKFLHDHEEDEDLVHAIEWGGGYYGEED